MSRMLTLAAMVCLGTTVLVRGDDAPKPPAPSVEQWIEQLGDKEFQKREAALKALQALGAQALPALVKARNHPDAEVRKRLAELIPALETAVALAPKLVTLQVEKKTLRQVIDELTKQTGYKIDLAAANEQQTFDYQFNKIPFWEALDRICADAGLTIYPVYGESRVQLTASTSHAPYVYRDGLFRFVANSFNHHRAVNFGSVPRNAGIPQRTDNLTFNFTVFVEPKLPLVSLGEVQIAEALDENKSSMLPAAGDPNSPRGVRRSYYGGGRAYSLEASIALGRPSDKAQMLKQLKGIVPVTLLIEQKPETVTDNVLASKGKKVTVGTTTFQIEDISEQANKQIQLKIAVTEENSGGGFEWTNTLTGRLELQDEEGKKFQAYSTGWSGGGNQNHVVLTMTLRPPANNAKASKLVFNTWKTMQHQVKFEFKDLPLP